MALSNNVIIGSTVGIAGSFLIGCLVVAVMLYHMCQCFKRRKDIHEGSQTDHNQLARGRVQPNNLLHPGDHALQILSDSPVHFCSEELRGITRNYADLIGTGGFGTVYKGILPNGVHVAVKLLRANLSAIVADRQFEAEVCTIGRTFHINLVRLKGFCMEEKALIYEYLEKSSLEKYLFGERPRIAFEKLCEIALGTAKGIAYLHSECENIIVHYDIKPGNILLTRTFEPKVADFGIARMYDRDATHSITLTEARGTPGYAAPELYTDPSARINPKSDVYSFGIVLFEIFGGRKHYNAMMPPEKRCYSKYVWKKIEAGLIDDLISEAGIDKEVHQVKARRMIKIALWCIQVSPIARPDMTRVVRMLEGVEEVAPPPNILVNNYYDNSESSEYYSAEAPNAGNAGSTIPR